MSNVSSKIYVKLAPVLWSTNHLTDIRQVLENGLYVTTAPNFIVCWYFL